MKKSIFYIFLPLFAVGAILTSCSSDDNNHDPGTSAIAFESKSIDLSGGDSEKEINIIFSETASMEGAIELSYKTENVLYGEDFTTTPSGEEGTIEIPFKENASGVSFTIHKLKDALPGEDKSVSFSIIGASLDNLNPQGNTEVKVAFTEQASLGSSIKPEVGGPNEPNQAYISLKSESQTVIKRDAWDLGFYGGSQSRVIINSSLKMFAGAVESTNIDALSEEDFTALIPQMALLASGSDQYVDDPSGDITKTAIAEISENDDDNKVYLINMGNKIGTEKPETGSVAVDQSNPDEPEKGKRGWMKVRILIDGNDYILQYAELNDKTHKEVRIPKNDAYNFAFYSFDTENVVDVEPAKNDWDLNFTTYTGTLDLPGDWGGGKSAYGYSDYVVINNLAGVQVYEVLAEDIAYKDFSTGDIDESKLSSNRTVIGDKWRDVFTQSARDDNYFILKDAEDNFYKIQFTALVNEDGERGHPAFDYELIGA